MTGRGRNYNQGNEWDSSRDDYNSTIYDPQYPDNDASGGVHLDHCRLYIKNIPKGLNEEGLRAAFAKFGTLVEVHLSKDPQKSYGLVKYETPGEAKLAMMKMNRTEPLRLHINIAHKSKKAVENRPSRDWQERNPNGGRDRTDRNDRMSISNRDREESGSIVSRGRNSRVQEDIPNGENNMDELLMEDDYAFSDILDPNLHLELESLKLEQLKVREEQLQCKQRVILLKQAERRPMTQMTNRCILPDGKIVVRNVNDRDSRDADVSYSAGAGDSLKIPGLQRIAAKLCVVCGGVADFYCAACGITPYCSERCQRRDWCDRHIKVCHNLARMDNEDAKGVRDFGDDESRIQPAPALRRPRLAMGMNNTREPQDRDDDFGALASKASVKSSGSSGKGDRFNKLQDNSRAPMKPKDNNQGRDECALGKASHQNSPKQQSPKKTQNTMYNRKPQRQQSREDDQKTTYQDTPKPAPLPTPKADPPKQNLVPKTSIPEASSFKPEVTKPMERVAPTASKATPNASTVVKPGSISDVTPTRKLIPKNFLIEKLAVGDAVILSVEAKAADCRTTRGDYVCLSMAEAFELQYQSLCEDYVLDCDRDDQPYKLIPGETCSYFNPEDGGWYRARVLNPTTVALLDSGKIVTITATDKCRKLPAKYETIPEFCCLLSSNVVEVGANLNCKIVSQTAGGYKLSMSDVDTNALVGDGEVTRWVPTVEYQPAVAVIPEVERPPVTNGSRMFLVLAASLDKAFVRPADSESQRKYNDVLQQVLLSAMNAQPLKAPPLKGQMVIAKFTDGNHYRALIKRTNVKQNKYQIEYIEYGNIEVSTLENLFPCPPEVELSTIPSLISMVKLADATDLSAAALELIEKLKDDEEELILTLPEGCKQAPSGSEATLTILKNKVNVNKKLIEMCTPEWKKIEERGGDVVETAHVMYEDMEYTVLPAAGCVVDVVDVSVLRGGVVSGHDRTDTRAAAVFTQLADKMAKYCNSELGREPYLPKPEELCIAQMPPCPDWYRAVFVEQLPGPGGSEARVCYLDYGNIAVVPVTVLRKMMPEFITGYPVMGLHIEIRNFPNGPTDEMLVSAIKTMKIDDEGRGTLKVSNCVKIGDGMYQVDAPELIRAMQM